MSRSKSEFMAIQEMFEDNHQYKLLEEYVLIDERIDKQNYYEGVFKKRKIHKDKSENSKRDC